MRCNLALNDFYVGGSGIIRSSVTALLQTCDFQDLDCFFMAKPKLRKRLYFGTLCPCVLTMAESQHTESSLPRNKISHSRRGRSRSKLSLPVVVIIVTLAGIVVATLDLNLRFLVFHNRVQVCSCQAGDVSCVVMCEREGLC